MPPCKQCSSVKLASLLSPEGHTHHESYVSLERAAATCEVCYIISIHLRSELAQAMTQSSEPHNLPADPEGWEPMLEGLATPINLRYSPGLALGVAKGRPRKINNDPRQRSSLYIRCGRAKRALASTSALGQKSGGFEQTDLKDVDLTAVMDIFVYEGT